MEPADVRLVGGTLCWLTTTSSSGQISPPRCFCWISRPFFLYAKTCRPGPGYWKGTFLEGSLSRYAVYALWVVSCLSLLLGFYPLLGALALFPLFRRIYIKGRWSTLFRGGGAPGFMSHYVMLYITAFELARWLDSSGRITHAAYTMLRVDFGVVLACSGTYKTLSGYMRGEGMEYGLANPIWGYFWRFFKRLSPKNPFLQMQDRMAALSQIVMGLALALSPLFAPLGWLGALMCAGTFFYLLFTVRLGRLAPLMMIMALPYVPDVGLDPMGVFGLERGFRAMALATPAVWALCALCWGYVVVLPFVKVMQYANRFFSRRFPEPFQSFFTRYQNWVPIIMWRVFTPDVTNFFIRIRKIDPATGTVTHLGDEESGYAYAPGGGLLWKLRYLHVTESIAVTTVFTTLKYFQSKRDLFDHKIVEYARTLGDGTFEFEYVAILKGETSFDFLPVSRFRVETASEDSSPRRSWSRTSTTALPPPSATSKKLAVMATMFPPGSPSRREAAHLRIEGLREAPARARSPLWSRFRRLRR